MSKWYNYIFLFFGLFGFTVSLTILFFAMRAVMDVGGYCAEGGAYQISVHCPEGVAYLTPLSIFGLLIFGGMYFFNVVPAAFNFGYLFWTALFGSLGWNFLDYAVFQSDNIEIAWLICAIVFLLMAFGPFILLVLVADDMKNYRIDFGKNLFRKIILFLYQIIAIALGIWVGAYVFAHLS